MRRVAALVCVCVWAVGGSRLHHRLCVPKMPLSKWNYFVILILFYFMQFFFSSLFLIYFTSFYGIRWKRTASMPKKERESEIRELCASSCSDWIPVSFTSSTGAKSHFRFLFVYQIRTPTTHPKTQGRLSGHYTIFFFTPLEYLASKRTVAAWQGTGTFTCVGHMYVRCCEWWFALIRLQRRWWNRPTTDTTNGNITGDRTLSFRIIKIVYCARGNDNRNVIALTSTHIHNRLAGVESTDEKLHILWTQAKRVKVRDIRWKAATK